jgi:hypothetical protein
MTRYIKTKLSIYIYIVMSGIKMVPLDKQYEKLVLTIPQKCPMGMFDCSQRLWYFKDGDTNHTVCQSCFDNEKYPDHIPHLIYCSNNSGMCCDHPSNEQIYPEIIEKGVRVGIYMYDPKIQLLELEQYDDNMYNIFGDNKIDYSLFGIIIRLDMEELGIYNADEDANKDIIAHTEISAFDIDTTYKHCSRNGVFNIFFKNITYGIESEKLRIDKIEEYDINIKIKIMNTYLGEIIHEIDNVRFTVKPKKPTEYTSDDESNIILEL